MKPVQQQKQRLRKEVLGRREQLSEFEWEEKSDQIISSLIHCDFFQKAMVVHTYVSMNKRREVCTDNLLTYLFENDKKAVVPVTNFTDGTLSHSEISSLDELATNKWGVREPKFINSIEISELDIIVVPMAAADKKGNRLGYGKGFYDKFLNRTRALKIGLTFHEFIFENIPVEEFDIKLDVIITEEDVIFP